MGLSKMPGMPNARGYQDDPVRNRYHAIADWPDGMPPKLLCSMVVIDDFGSSVPYIDEGGGQIGIDIPCAICMMALRRKMRADARAKAGA